MKRSFVAGLTIVLASCATPPAPVQQIVRVEVPTRVPVRCAIRIPPRPRYADQDAARAADVFQQVQALQLGIAQRKAREEALERAVASCGGTVGR